MDQLTIADVVGLAMFTACWLGYAWISRKLVHNTINAGLDSLRVAWMRTMMRRENRIVDSALIGHVVHSASFFTSTSLIVIGALLSLLSNVDRVQPAVEQLAFVHPISRTIFELKLVLPLLVLLHGFASLSWSLRQLNYLIALIGAVPDRKSLGTYPEPLAEALGHSLSAALSTFNTGIRAYYFAIGGLAWVISPYALALGALAIMAMLGWRQKYSKAAAYFRDAKLAMEAAHLNANSQQ